MDVLTIITPFLPLIGGGLLMGTILLCYFYRYRNMTILQLMNNSAPNSPELMYTPPEPSAPPDF